MRCEAPVGLEADGRRALSTLGVRTALDLREPIEQRNDPVDFGTLEIDVRRVALLNGEVDVDTPRGLPDFYRDVLAVCGPRIAAATQELASPGALPALVFCSAGKDRTGLVCGLLLSALGVEDADVAEDYGRSERAVAGEFRIELEARATRAGISEQALAVKLGAPREYMLDLLSELRAKYGGAAAYLTGHGVRSEQLETLRVQLLDSGGEPRRSQPD